MYDKWEKEIIDLMLKDDKQMKKWNESANDAEISLNEYDTFLGFVDKYGKTRDEKNISRSYTILDFGCGYNLQSLLFTDYKEVISIDISIDTDMGEYQEKKLKTYTWRGKNNKVFEMTGEKFLEQEFLKYDLSKCFAFCVAVPDVKLQKQIKEIFKNNSYVWYPGTGEII